MGAVGIEGLASTLQILVSFLLVVRFSSMSFEPSASSEAELRQLWGGGKVPPLTPREMELSIKLWQKIKTRKQREQKLGSDIVSGCNDIVGYQGERERER